MLASTSVHAVSTIFTSLSRRHIFVAYIALLAVLSELLIVTLAAIPFNLATLLEAFRVSVFVSVGIIGLMIATLPFVLMRYKDSVVAPPNSVADTMQYLSEPGNEVVGLFAGLATVGRRERDKAAERSGMRYRLTEMGRGRLNVGVERDEWSG